MSTIRIFYVSFLMAIAGYAVLLLLCFTNMSTVFLLFIPGFLIFAANGMLTVLTTVFLANTCLLYTSPHHSCVVPSEWYDLLLLPAGFHEPVLW